MALFPLSCGLRLLLQPCLPARAGVARARRVRAGVVRARSEAEQHGPAWMPCPCSAGRASELQGCGNRGASCCAAVLLAGLLPARLFSDVIEEGGTFERGLNSALEEKPLRDLVALLGAQPG